MYFFFLAVVLFLQFLQSVQGFKPASTVLPCRSSVPRLKQSTLKMVDDTTVGWTMTTTVVIAQMLYCHITIRRQTAAIEAKLDKMLAHTLSTYEQMEQDFIATSDATMRKMDAANKRFDERIEAAKKSLEGLVSKCRSSELLEAAFEKRCLEIVEALAAKKQLAAKKHGRSTQGKNE
jgi:low affinity Fe/Cu permease